jgi:hypothetical protein
MLVLNPAPITTLMPSAWPRVPTTVKARQTIHVTVGCYLPSLFRSAEILRSALSGAGRLRWRTTEGLFKALSDELVVLSSYSPECC